MYHSLDEAGIVTISSFTGQRCNVDLPSWVGSLAEALLLVREAHSNAFVDEAGHSHFHPAIEYLEDTSSGTVIECLTDLRKAREVLVHAKPRTAANTSSWVVSTSSSLFPEAFDSSSSYAEPFYGGSSAAPVDISAETAPVLSHKSMRSAAPSFLKGNASANVEELIRYHQTLRHDVARRHNSAAGEASRGSSRRQSRRLAAPLTSPPREDNDDIHGSVGSSTVRDELPRHHHRRMISPSIKDIDAWRAPTRDGVQVPPEPGSSAAPSSITEAVVPTMRVAALLTSPLPEIDTEPDEWRPDSRHAFSLEALHDGDEEARGRSSHENTSRLETEIPAEVIEYSPPSGSVKDEEEEHEYAAEIGDTHRREAPVIRAASSTSERSKDEWGAQESVLPSGASWVGQSYLVGAPIEPMGIRPPLCTGEEVPDGGEPHAVVQDFQPIEINCVGVRVEAGDVNVRKHRMIDRIVQTWGIAPPPTLLFREVISEKAHDAVRGVVSGASSLRDLRLVIEGPSGSGVTTAALVIAGENILPLQPIPHASAQSLVVPVVIHDLLAVARHRVAPEDVNTQWLWCVAHEWITSCIRMIDAALGGDASLDEEAIAAWCFPPISVLMSSLSSALPSEKERQSVSSQLAAALRGCCPALRAEEAWGMVHSSLLVPTQQLVSYIGAVLLAAPADPSGATRLMSVVAAAMQFVPLCVARLFGWSSVLYMVDGMREHTTTQTGGLNDLMELLRMVLVDESCSTFLSAAAIGATGCVYCRHTSWVEALSHRGCAPHDDAFVPPSYDATTEGSTTGYERVLLCGALRVCVIGIVPDAIAVSRYGFPAYLNVAVPQADGSGASRRKPSEQRHMERTDSIAPSRSNRAFPLAVFMGAPGFLSLLYPHVMAVEDNTRAHDEWVLTLRGEDAEVLCELVEVCSAAAGQT